MISSLPPKLPQHQLQLLHPAQAKTSTAMYRLNARKSMAVQQGEVCKYSSSGGRSMSNTLIYLYRHPPMRGDKSRK
jgi:hypothetical protein